MRDFHPSCFLLAVGSIHLVGASPRTSAKSLAVSLLHFVQMPEQVYIRFDDQGLSVSSWVSSTAARGSGCCHVGASWPMGSCSISLGRSGRAPHWVFAGGGRSDLSSSAVLRGHRSCGCPSSASPCCIAPSLGPHCLSFPLGCARCAAPKRRIGGSGTLATHLTPTQVHSSPFPRVSFGLGPPDVVRQPPSRQVHVQFPDLEPCLQAFCRACLLSLLSLGAGLTPLCRSFFCILFLALCKVLASAVQRRRRPSRRSPAVTFEGLVGRALSGLGCTLPAQPVLPWRPPTARRRSGRWRSSSVSRLGDRVISSLLLGALGGALPRCVWGAPPWLPSVQAAEAFPEGSASTSLPEVLPASASSFQGTAPLVEPSPASHAIAPLPCAASCPTTIARSWDEPMSFPSSPTLGTRFFLVLCPMHHAEAVQVCLRIPGTAVDAALAEVREALAFLRLSFAGTLVPTFPQLHEGYGSLVLGGAWHQDYGDAILALDFTALGGSVFAQHFPLHCRASDLHVHASAQGIGDYEVYLFGSSTPLPRDGHFHAVHGGLVKFLPRHQAPIWQGSFVDKLGSAASWRSLPSLPQCPPDPFCAVGCPGSGPLVGLRDLSPPQSTDLAAFLGYAPSDITCMQPSHGMLQNVCASAVEAAAVVAVFPSPPPPGRTTMPVILYFWTAGRLAVRLRLSGSGTRLFP